MTSDDEHTTILTTLEPPKKKRKKGLTLPKSNYIGPFNSLDNGPPTNPVDEIAYQHDHAYQQLMDAGINPYLTVNEADKDMLTALFLMKKKRKFPKHFLAAVFGISAKMAANKALCILSDGVIGQRDHTPVHKVPEYERLYGLSRRNKSYDSVSKSWK